MENQGFDLVVVDSGTDQQGHVPKDLTGSSGGVHHEGPIELLIEQDADQGQPFQICAIQIQLIVWIDASRQVSRQAG